MSVPSDFVATLVDVSLASLPTMYQGDARLFCESRDRDGRQHGVSLRYTLICLIGLHRARAAGHDVPFDLDAIYERVLGLAVETPADAGLLLWAAALYAPGTGADFVGVVGSRLATQPRAERTGMHAGLALAGLVAYGEVSGDADVVRQARGVREQITVEYGNDRSGLFFHAPPGTMRRSMPNFATQVYLTYGLARESMLSGEPIGADRAEACVRTLAGLQRSDGGWPWIYNTAGSAVEDFEIYGVHQDAMAPMAILAVDDAGLSGYRPLVDRGLEWLTGKNTLGLDMVDRSRMLIYRSIRRPRPLDRIMLAVNTVSSGVARKAPLRGTGRVELNATCRPYHPGWILEAWSGRDR